MFERLFLPSSIIIVIFVLLTTTLLPSICGRIQRDVDHDERKEGGDRREKRDGGIVSGPVAAALVSGMIGMTAKAVSDITAYMPHPSDGGCLWFGRAPLCNKVCPSEFDYIRGHNGRCSNSWFAGNCIPDPSFGEPCSTIFGSTFTKRFCCKSDPKDCTWSGRWMGANNAHNMYCKYDHSEGRCGRLDCSVNHFTFKGYNSSLIAGTNCDMLEMWGYAGRATCGYIAWYDESYELLKEQRVICSLPVSLHPLCPLSPHLVTLVLMVVLTIGKTEPEFCQSWLVLAGREATYGAA
uniref:Uncharacterized protein n=1 Tax=Plectus sambesii TaxID=2011161 RepID=A0A914WC30_9BILA